MWIYILKPKKSEDAHKNKTWMKMVSLRLNFEKSSRVCTWKRPDSNGALYLTIQIQTWLYCEKCKNKFWFIRKLNKHMENVHDKEIMWWREIFSLDKLHYVWEKFSINLKKHRLYVRKTFRVLQYMQKMSKHWRKFRYSRMLFSFNMETHNVVNVKKLPNM